MSEEPLNDDSEEEFDENSEIFEKKDNPKKPFVNPRLTVVETLYYQEKFDEEPVSIETRSCRTLKTSGEEPYQRRKKLGEEWEKLDLGWLATNVGTVHIINDAGKDFQGVKSAEEKEALALQVIRIRFSKDSVGDTLVHPGDSTRFCPYSEDIWIRCSSGETRYRLFIVPR